MSRGWKWKSGEWYISCDVCAKQIYASQSKKRWDGLIVCSDDYEPRHEQDLIKVRHENQSVPFSRVEPPDVFVDVPYITIYVDDYYVTDDYFEDLD